MKFSGSVLSMQTAAGYPDIVSVYLVADMEVKVFASSCVKNAHDMVGPDMVVRVACIR